MNRKTFAILLGAALLALGLGLWFGQTSEPVISGSKNFNKINQYTSITQYPQAKVIADFELHESNGETFNLERLRGRWSLLFFGYSQCPDICPTTLSSMAAIYQNLETEFIADDLPNIVFVSIDPERDQLEQLGSYIRFFHPNFLAATGEHSQLEALTRQLGLLYTIEAHDAGVTDYLVDHSSGIVLLNKEGYLHGLLPTPHEVEQISSDLTQLLSP